MSSRTAPACCSSAFSCGMWKAFHTVPSPHTLHFLVYPTTSSTMYHPTFCVMFLIKLKGQMDFHCNNVGVGGAWFPGWVEPDSLGGWSLIPWWVEAWTDDLTSYVAGVTAKAQAEEALWLATSPYPHCSLPIRSHSQPHMFFWACCGSLKSHPSGFREGRCLYAWLISN